MSSDEDDFLYDDDEDQDEVTEDDVDENDDDGIGMDMDAFTSTPEMMGAQAGSSGASTSATASTSKDHHHHSFKGTSDEEDFYYEILTTDEIVSHMVKCIKDVQSVVQIQPTLVRVLLNHFKWDKEKLMEKFYSDSQDKMFDEAKILSPFAQQQPNKNKKSCGKKGASCSSTSECDICLLSLRKTMMFNLECGHLYCKTCWAEYLTMRIKDEGTGSGAITCPTPSCAFIIEDETVLKLVEDPRVKLKYQQLMANSFVACNRLMRWCSAPDCGYASRAMTVEAKAIRCKCGHVYCFGCSEKWHDPVRCHLIKKWIKKCDDDSETSNWISANTKECPRCHATIEKDGGCNHMICKNQSCKMDFCWVCLGPWEPHGSSWYNCNRYDEDDAVVARTNQEKSRSALQRYLFYCNRYMNHLQSLKFENKLYQMVKDKMEEMQQHNMSWIEVQFLKKAVDILCECRRTLMFTYVFAYYLKKNNQCELFEDNQKDLETSTEILSEYLERDICAENLVDIKQKVQDKYRYCDSRRKVLLDHVHEGYEKDWWLYTELDVTS